MVKSHKTEGYLKNEGVDFKYLKSVGLDEIIIDAETKLNIRLDLNLDENYVRELVTSLEGGDEFPAIVVAPGKNGRYRLINGLHRHAAYVRMEYPVIDAYLIDSTDPVVLDRLRRGINRIEGKRTSTEEAIRHALMLISKDGLSIIDAARALRIPRGTLSHHVRAEKVAVRLESLQVDSSGLSTTDLMSMHMIARDSHLKAIAELAKKARLNKSEISELAHDVQEALSVSDQAADDVIERWREDLKDRMGRTGGGKYRPTSPFRSMRTYLEKSSAALEKMASIPQAITTAGNLEVKKTITHLRETARTLNAYADELDEALRAVSTE